MAAYTVMTQRSPRSEWQRLLESDDLVEALKHPVPWVKMHALRSKGSAKVLDSNDRLVFEAIGDAHGERVLTVRRYPPRVV